MISYIKSADINLTFKYLEKNIPGRISWSNHHLITSKLKDETKLKPHPTKPKTSTLVNVKLT